MGLLDCFIFTLEMLKTMNNLSPTFMKGIFEEKISYYSLCNSDNLQMPKVRTTIYIAQKIFSLKAYPCGPNCPIV